MKKEEDYEPDHDIEAKDIRMEIEDPARRFGPVGYYVAPSDEIFEDIKQAAIALWMTFDDTYGYATGKVDRIKDITNVRDNYAYMVAMFDHGRQNTLVHMLRRDETRDFVQALLDYSRSII